MGVGVRTTDLAAASAVDEVLGNQTVNGEKRSRRIPVEAFGQVLLAVASFRDALAAASAGVTVKQTWSQLSAIAGTRNGQPGRVTGPSAGTHTDPVVGGTVQNVGEYAWSTSPAGWQWLKALDDFAGLKANVDAMLSGSSAGLDTFAEIEARFTALLGGVSSTFDTLSKLADGIGVQKGRIDTMLSGSSAGLDTFAEIEARFTALMGGVSSAFDTLAELADGIGIQKGRIDTMLSGSSAGLDTFAEIEARFTALMGGVSSAFDTLSKLADGIGVQKGRIDTMLSGSSAGLDTFAEIEARFTALMGGVSSAFDTLAELADGIGIQKGRIDTMLSGSSAGLDTFAEIEARFTALMGGVSSAFDTLSKLADGIGVQKGRIDTMLSGSSAGLDTFAEIEARFTTLMGGVSSAFDTLAELADGIGAQKARIDTMLSGSSAGLDTFAEIEARFTALMGGVSSAFDTLSKLADGIGIQKGRIDTMLSGSSAGLDTFAEIEARFTTLMGGVSSAFDTLAELADGIGAQKARIDTMLSGSSAGLDTFAEIEARFTALLGGVSSAFDTLNKLADGIGIQKGRIDTMLSGSSAGLDTFAEVGSAIATEASTRAQDDATEATARANADAYLDGKIDAATGRLESVTSSAGRGFSAGYEPGTVTPTLEAKLDRNGFLVVDAEPRAVYAAPGTIGIPPAVISLGGGLPLVCRQQSKASPAPASGKKRKDRVSVNPSTGEMTVTLGTERPQNPWAWMGDIPAGQIEIGRIYNDGVHAIYTPMWGWSEGVAQTRRALWAAWAESNRPRLRVTRQRLAAGLPVRMIVHGDSRTAIDNNGAPAYVNANPNSYYSGNDATSWRRDVPENHYSAYGMYDDATRTRLGFGNAQRLDFGDGYGAIHCKQSFMWEVVKRIEAAYPGQSFSAAPGTPSGSSYRNWSIGGTNSGTGTSADGYAQGLEPARWNAVKADIIAGQTLFVCCFGMNERGFPTTYGNFVTMATQAKALGAEVLFVSTTRYSPGFYSEALDDWRFTCRETVRAAIDTGSAYVDVSEIVAPEHLSGTGISDLELADTYPTGGGHEGVNVQRAIADRIFHLLG